MEGFLNKDFDTKIKHSFLNQPLLSYPLLHHLSHPSDQIHLANQFLEL